MNTPLLYNIDSCALTPGALHLEGWVVAPEQPLDSVTLLVDGLPWIENVALVEDGVYQRRFSYLPHASYAGFHVNAPPPHPLAPDRIFEITLVALQSGKEFDRVTIPLRDFTQVSQRAPLPPIALQEHIGQMRPDPELVLAGGWRIYLDLKRALAPYHPVDQARHILDWGCGCGRVIRFLVEDVPADRISGCDIDEAAIQWMRANMPGSAYATIAGLPPTPYFENTFDLVYGISIFTHLDEATQTRWLEELRRITALGGYVAVSVLSPENVPPKQRAHITAKGLFDMRSEQASTFAPYVGPDYYRLTFHSREYIEQRWAEYFAIVGYIPYGINSHQDLVIMRKSQ